MQHITAYTLCKEQLKILEAIIINKRKNQQYLSPQVTTF